MVAQAVLILFSKGKIPKDKSWKACRMLMGSVDTFLSQLRNYDKENIHPEIVKAIQPYITDKGKKKKTKKIRYFTWIILRGNQISDIRVYLACRSLSRLFKSYNYTSYYVSLILRLEFDPDVIYSKSRAAAGLCSWVKNIMVFHYINENVRPLRVALAQANAELKAAMDKLNLLRNRLAVSLTVIRSISRYICVVTVEKQVGDFLIYACRNFKKCWISWRIR